MKQARLERLQRGLRRRNEREQRRREEQLERLQRRLQIALPLLKAAQHYLSREEWAMLGHFRRLEEPEQLQIVEQMKWLVWR